MTAGGLARTLDTFAQRRPEIASRLRVFEIDQPGTQDWKRRRLIELGYTIPDWLRYAPVDFETSANWWEQLCAAGFDPSRPAVVASTGVRYPGQRSAETRRVNLSEGIPVDGDAWRFAQRCGAEL